MANKYLKRKFTMREIILMIVLLGVLFLGMYFWLVYYPVRDRLAEVEAEQEELQLQIDVASARETIYDHMTKELETIMQLPEEKRTKMPAYNNIKELVACFGDIFTGMEPSIRYSTPTLEDGVYSRSISFSFKIAGVDRENFASDYLKAKDVLYKLSHTEYRSLMTDVTISPDPQTGDIENNSLSISCTVIFYELA